jgi:hypothetical protein
MKSNEWFTVDREGLAEQFANFPNERMVAELVQNCFDTDAGTCAVEIKQIAKMGQTAVQVTDNHPEGFADLRDAYTLFRSTPKREDPEKRGRFNLGEKIVLSRAVKGQIRTTKGTVEFGKDGRADSKGRRRAGSEVTVYFEQWSPDEYDRTIGFLERLYAPDTIEFTVNGKRVTSPVAEKSITTKLATEYLKPTSEGHKVLTRTQRKTEVRFYAKRGATAQLCELGLPVCDIEGPFDVDVQQKIPMSQDRTLVSQSYLQDIYAEMLLHMSDKMDLDELGRAHVRAAIEDDRIPPEVAADLFKQQFGDNAVLDNPFDSDANQMATRSGATLVSGRTFGGGVNAKLRDGGIETSTMAYSRDREQLEHDENMPGDFKELVTERPEHAQLREYTKYLCEVCYDITGIEVAFGNWAGNVAAFYEKRGRVTYNLRIVTKAKLNQLVSQCTSLILHELAHCCGQGHDGVYDHAYEKSVNVHTARLAQHPSEYAAFEPALFAE